MHIHVFAFLIVYNDAGGHEGNHVGNEKYPMLGESVVVGWLVALPKLLFLWCEERTD
jgi:hypothetical protein